MRAEDFKPRKAYLKYLFGEFNLFTLKLHILEYDKHFTHINSSFDSINIPNLILDKHSGILLNSFPTDKTMPKFRINKQFIRYTPRQYHRFYIHGIGTFEGYLKKFSSKSRYNLHRKVKKYDEFCDTQKNLKEYSDIQGINQFYTLARELSKKTYQERLLGSGLPTSDEFKRSMEDGAKQNLVKGYILFHHDKPVAYLYCPIAFGNIYLYAYLGYDPKYRQWSPGNVLQYKVLQAIFHKQQEFIFDFTQGEGEHKKFFATHSKKCADIYFLKCTLLNLFIVCSHITLSKASHVIVNTLTIFSLKSKIKKLLREV